MITLKYADINNADLVAAFKTIQKQNLPLKVSYRINKIADKIDQEIRSFTVTYSEFLRDHCAKNEDGSPVFKLNEEGKMIGYEMNGAEETKTKEKALFQKEFSIEVNQIDVSDIDGINIAPETLHHLSPFISGLETLA